MLNVYYGNMPEAIYNTAAYFSNVFQKTWLDDKYVRRMIKSVDHSEVIGDYLIKSKALGMISPMQLSGGVKTLILTYFKPDIVFSITKLFQYKIIFIIFMNPFTFKVILI